MIEEWNIQRLKSRPRVCVFCGQPPKGKNNEHIIPRWLIDLTGDPSRQIRLGPFTSQSLLKGREELIRQFSFDAFTFPSCSDCNSEFAQLEADAQGAVTKLLNADPLSATDLDVLFNWFDKVRVGLWLGYHYFLDHNYWGIAPHFFIKDRIAKADRALVTYRSRDFEPGIRFAGVNTPAFAHVPSCFTLVINEWFLMNISYQFLAARGAGLPYPEHMELNAEEQLGVAFTPGTGQLAHPLLPIDYDRSGVTLGQAIHVGLGVSAPDEARVSRQYAKDMTLEADRTVPLLERDGHLSTYPAFSTLDWIPDINMDFEELSQVNAIDTLLIQNELIERIPLSTEIPSEQREFMDTEFKNCVDANNSLIEIFRGMKS